MTPDLEPQSIKRLDQFKIIYDYVKFHLTLYLSTPAVMALVGNALSISDQNVFKYSLLISIVIFLVSGVDASLFMGRYINKPWTTDFPSGQMWQYLFSFRRRLFHHIFYWIGVVVTLFGVIFSYISKTT